MLMDGFTPYSIHRSATPGIPLEHQPTHLVDSNPDDPVPDADDLVPADDRWEHRDLQDMLREVTDTSGVAPDDVLRWETNLQTDPQLPHPNRRGLLRDFISVAQRAQFLTDAGYHLDSPSAAAMLGLEISDSQYPTKLS